MSIFLQCKRYRQGIAGTQKRLGIGIIAMPPERQPGMPLHANAPHIGTWIKFRNCLKNQLTALRWLYPKRNFQHHSFRTANDAIALAVSDKLFLTKSLVNLKRYKIKIDLETMNEWVKDPKDKLRTPN